ncbi:MAG: ACT domain-containing protein [Myxococcales bacterium]|nr:ACT domain-containing protein [Myxococcales bacterium]
MSKRFRVLTAAGPDRPGLVKGISGAIHRGRANLEDSRMAVLGGEFVMLVLMSGTPAELDEAESAARAVATSLGLDCSFRDTAVPEPTRGVLAYELRVTGLDQPGIVEAVTTVLAASAVNVASLETSVVHQPLTGTPMFVLEARLHVPSTVVLSELRRDLTRVGEDQNLDLVLEADT